MSGISHQSQCFSPGRAIMSSLAIKEARGIVSVLIGPMAPGQKLKHAWPRIARATGLAERRLKGIWHREPIAASGDARRSLPASMNAHSSALAGVDVMACSKLPEAQASGFSLTLPIPPSLNSTTKNIRARGRAPTKVAVEWRRIAALHIADAGVEPIEGRYVALLLLPMGMNGDCDNRIKPALDLLVTLKLVPDDRFADVMAFRFPTVSDGFCRLIIHSVNPRLRSGVSVARTLLAALPGGEGEAAP